MKIKQILNILTVFLVLLAFIKCFKFIPIPLIIFVTLAIIFSFFYELKNRKILTIISAIFIILFFRKLSIETIISSGINSIVFLIGIKFLEEKSYRDYMEIFALVIFLYSASTLLDFNISFLFYIIFTLLISTITTIFLIFYEKNKNLRLNRIEIYSISLSGFLLILLSIPLTIILFIILPRVENPIFDFLSHENSAVTGFTDKIKIGDVREIQENKQVAFRVKMKRIPEKYLYWRGVSLTTFNGIMWSSPEKNFKDLVVIKNNFRNRNFNQEIFLNPYPYPYLFSLDKSIIFIEKRFLNYIKDRKITRRIKYYGYLLSSGKFYEKITDRSKYLQVPENINPKVVELAKKLKTPENIFKFLTSGKFKYSLENLPVSSHPLYDFLFKYKKGNCEFFATALAIMLRLNNIPARIVVGYYGGSYNKIGGYYIIREANAHTWVEMNLHNYWIRIDPTVVIPIINSKLKKQSLFDKISNLLDIINYYWFIFVINYNFEKQLNLAIKVGYSLENLKKFFKIILIGFMLLLGIMLILKFKKPSYEEILLKDLKKKLKKFNIDFQKSYGLYEIAEKLNNKNFLVFTEKFYECVFKNEKITENDFRYLKNLLKKL